MYPSGVWRGWWEQPILGRQAMGPLVLRFADGRIEGEGRDIVGPFTFAGEYDDRGGIRMVKQYLGRHQVLYEGTYDGEGTLLGRWSIPPLWSGPFALSPSRERPPGRRGHRGVVRRPPTDRVTDAAATCLFPGRDLPGHKRRGATVEGMNWPAILAMYLAVLVFGLTAAVALGLLIARWVRAASVVFASAVLAAAGLLALAMLSFWVQESDFGLEVELGVTAASLLLAGVGQFVAALRSGRDYGAALGCAAVAFYLLSSPLGWRSWDVGLLGALGRRLTDIGIGFPILLGLLPAAASVAIAVFLPFRARPANCPQTHFDRDRNAAICLPPRPTTRPGGG